MSKMNIKQAIQSYTTSIKVEGTPYFIDGGDNTPRYVETGEKLSIQINSEEIDVFQVPSKEEYDELISWDILGSVVLKEDMLKCFILNLGNLLDKNIICEGNSDKLGYKIVVDTQEVLTENYELFIANISKVFDLGEIRKKDNKYVNFCEDLIKKEGRLCVFEINNLKILDSELQKRIQAAPAEFVRTNLAIINNDINSQLTFFEFNIYNREEADVIVGKESLLSKYPFYADLLCFLESAQKMQYNHLKYLEYYHVLEYFITLVAYKNLEVSMKKFVSIYLEGGNYEEFRSALAKISDNKDIAYLGQDQPLLDVLKQVDTAYIANVINNYKLYDLLKINIFGINGTRLLFEKVVDDPKKIQWVKVEKENEEEFYKRLYQRLYSIRNALTHSKAKFRKRAEMAFLPLPEYQDKLKEDVILIRELAIKLCKIQCVNPETEL